MKTIGSSTYALDTNIVIDLFKGRRDIADKIDAAQKVYLPIPTHATTRNPSYVYIIRVIEALCAVKGVLLYKRYNDDFPFSESP